MQAPEQQVPDYLWLWRKRGRSSPAERPWGLVSRRSSAHADRRVWQDVYRPKTSAGEVYLKLTVIDNVLIVSFKEL